MQVHGHELLAAAPGTTRQVHSFHYGPTDAQGKVYIQASLHADELPAMLVFSASRRVTVAAMASRYAAFMVLALWPPTPTADPSDAG